MPFAFDREVSSFPDRWENPTRGQVHGSVLRRLGYGRVCFLSKSGEFEEKEVEVLTKQVRFRARNAHNSRFSFFAFTSSPFGSKPLRVSGIGVKASPFCLHPFRELFVSFSSFTLIVL